MTPFMRMAFSTFFQQLCVGFHGFLHLFCFHVRLRSFLPLPYKFVWVQSVFGAAYFNNSIQFGRNVWTNDFQHRHLPQFVLVHKSSHTFAMQFSLSLSLSHLFLKATRRFQDAQNLDPCVFPKQGNIKTIPENASALPPEISHKLLGHTYVAITIRTTASSTRDPQQNAPRHVKHVALGVL